MVDVSKKIPVPKIPKPIVSSPVLYHVPADPGGPNTILPAIVTMVHEGPADSGMVVDLNVFTPVGVEQRIAVPHESMADGATHWDWHAHQVRDVSPVVIAEAPQLEPLDGTTVRQIIS